MLTGLVLVWKSTSRRSNAAQVSCRAWVADASKWSTVFASKAGSHSPPACFVHHTPGSKMAKVATPAGPARPGRPKPY